MNAEQFVARITELRLQRGVSARDMSLSLGQNCGYINNIEAGKALPSMLVFFFICEYLEISPQEFFEVENHDTDRINVIKSYLKKLNEDQLLHMDAIIRDLAK